MIEKQILVSQVKEKDSYAPNITTWRGVKMVRQHSFLSSVREIITRIDKLDYVKIGIIGDQHSGKSTLAEALAHEIHVMALKELGIHFQVKLLDRKKLLDFKNTISNLSGANYILIFDDISFLHELSPKQLMEIKATATMIRHLPGGQDVKIVQIDNYHYTKAHDKWLRQSRFKFFTSIGGEETQNVISMTSPKFTRRIERFQKLHVNAFNSGFCTFMLDRKQKPFVYKYRDPFIPVLFWNEQSARIIMTPTRQWLDRNCAICSTSLGIKDENFNLEKFKEQFDIKYKEYGKTAVKLKMFVLGINSYNPRLSRAINDLSRTMSENNFSIIELGKLYNLEQTRPVFTKDYKKIFQQSLDDTEKGEKEEKIQEKPMNNHIGEIKPW